MNVDTSSPGVQLIAEERERQKNVEGWSAEHDDEYKGGELAYAAVAYALPAEAEVLFSSTMRMNLWPWDRKWWKPTTELRDLIIAGALIAAEIDRRKRAEGIPVEIPNRDGDQDAVTA